MFRKLSRMFKEAAWGIKHHFAMASGAANAVMVTLVLVSLLTLIIANVSQITYDIQKDIQIFAKIDHEVSEEQIESLQTRIQRIAGVKQVAFSSADQELDLFIEKYGEDGSIFEAYRQDNPLSRAFLIDVETGYSLSEVSSQIAAIDGMSGVEFGGSTVEQFVKVLDNIRLFGYGIVAALVLLAVFLINSTIKLTINSRKEEIAIMRLVGATNGYIRAPLVLEGMFIGLMGSIVPVLLTILGYSYVYKKLNGQIITGVLSLIDIFPFTLYVSLIIAAIGMVVGVIGSVLSANKFLRWKRWELLLKF